MGSIQEKEAQWMSIDQLTNLLLSIKKAYTAHELNDCLFELTKLMGAQQHLLLGFKHSQLGYGNWYMDTSIKSSLREDYLQLNTLFTDPLFSQISHSGELCTWQCVASTHTSNLMQCAAAFSLHDGLVISYRDMSEHWLALGFAHSKKVTQDQFNHASVLLPAVLPALLGCMKMVNQAESSPEQRLSAREKQCLALASNGHTAKAIAEHLGIAERTVLFHFANAVQKLGAKNRQHAITEALMQNLLAQELLQMGQSMVFTARSG